MGSEQLDAGPLLLRAGADDVARSLVASADAPMPAGLATLCTQSQTQARASGDRTACLGATPMFSTSRDRRGLSPRLCGYPLRVPCKTCISGFSSIFHKP